METFFQDIRFALRVLRKNPSFAVIAVVVLAVGIGASTAIFSIVDTVLLRPLPYPGAERMVLLENYYKSIGNTPISFPQFQFWREQRQIFDQVITYTNGSAALTGQGEPEQVKILKVSSNLLPTLGISPVAGRSFRDDEEPKTAAPVAMLSEAFWRKHYQASPAALGQKLTLNDDVFTIIGVVPESFRIGRADFNLVTPLRFNPPAGLNFLPAIGRVRPDMNIARSRDAIKGVLPAYEKAAGKVNDVVLTGYQEAMVGDSRPLLLVLLAAVVAVLLIACANTANLLLARAASREKEIAIRISLGAGRTRLARQLLTESTLLSLGGGILGVLLAWGSLSFLTTLLARQLPGAIAIHLDGRILGFALLLSVITGLLFGMAPVLQVVGGKLHDRLKQGGRQSGSASGQGIRQALVVGEIAISLVLLAGAGLLLRSMLRLINVDKGFSSDHVITMTVQPSPIRYSDPRKEISYLQQITDKLNAMPGVQSAGMLHTIPLTAANTNGGVKIEGRQGEPPNADKQYVGGKYFEALRIPLLKGRFFSDGDTPDSPKVVIINQAFARQFFPGEDPIGKRIDVAWGDTGWCQIIGVVGDVKQGSLGEKVHPSTFVLYAQSSSIMKYLSVSVVVRSSQDPVSMVQTIRAGIQQIDSNQPVSDIWTMDNIVSESLAPQRAPTWLFGAFSAIALFLAAIGIYGVLSYFVVQRNQEIGVRMALGAQRSNVLGLILRQGGRLIAIGVAIGTVGAFFAARALTTFLFGIKPTDLPTFISVAVLLAVLGLVACAVPALRATRVDPLVALRNE